MSANKFTGDRWKELVAHGHALREAGSPPALDNPPAAPRANVVRAYFQRYIRTNRYVWLGASLLVLTLCLALNLSPSGGRPGRQPVFGSVNLNGRPVAGGSVSFYPSEGRSGPAATTAIAQGRYQFTTADGPFTGPHHVVVLFFRDAADAASLKVQNNQTDNSASKTKSSAAQKAADEHRSHGHELDLEVPSIGSLRIDLAIPE